MSTLTFMKEVFRTNKTTGALAPSSRRLAEAVTDMAGVRDANVIVEFGPGTGVFTEAIVAKKKPDAHFIAMEVNPIFVEATRRRCPGVVVHEDSAANTRKYLREAGHEHCDVIVSGLPWTRFEDDLQNALLEATYDVLAPGGRFVTFGYAFSPLFPAGRAFFKGKFQDKFARNSKSPMIWKNFPPCVVYIGEKPSEEAG